MSFQPDTSDHNAPTLADGGPLRLRPIDSSDRAGVAALFARLSPESRYRRFLSPKPRLTPRELSYLTEVDQVRHVAIAAVDELSGAIVGLSEYVQTSDQACVAEVAVVVVDELQGQGVGAALATRAMQRACSTGFARLTATTLWENRAARGLLRRLGFRAQASNGREIEHLLELNCEQGGAALPRHNPPSTIDAKDTDKLAPHLTSGLAKARIADFRRDADARTLAHRRDEPSRTFNDERRSVTLRLASPGDECAVGRLAALDSSTPPARPLLLADVDGQPLAALALSDGSVVADPFQATADLIDLLRARARQLDGDHRMRRPGRAVPAIMTRR